MNRIFFAFVLQLLIVPFLLIYGVRGHRAEDCIEVGFARASYMNVDQGYQIARENMISRWKEEDETEIPSFNMLSPQMKNVSRAADLLEETSRQVLEIIRKTRVGKRCASEWLLKGVEKHVQPLIQLDKEFAEELGLVMSFRCLVGSPYPNVDGTCINEQGPDMGANGGKFLRLMPPMTGKGGFALRGSSNSARTLPSAREVARLVRKHLKESPLLTSDLFGLFSEFIAADTFSIATNPHLELVNCCEKIELFEKIEDCEPIMIAESDPLYSTLKCINYKRSINAQAILGHRESLSLISTYLDATPIYGSTNEKAFERKSGYFGYLNIPESLDYEDLSLKSLNQRCDFPRSFEGCFKGLREDDVDFHEGVRLLFVLEHNRIADVLAEINPHFDDALLYNEARRINIAQYNAILYGEFVPTLIGDELSVKHSLPPGSEGPGAQFIPDVNPGVLTSFALGAYRNPGVLTEWSVGMERSDLLNLAHYQSVNDDPVKDLLAMDIQRGRDHGVPNYIEWRRFCDPGFPLDSFSALEPLLFDGAAKELSSLYEGEFMDMDLLVALLEKPEAGAAVGKTFTCILADQYARLKTGNRLHWDHESSMLTKEQRDAIRSQSSMGGVLCRNLKLETVPKNPFNLTSESNPEVSCSEMPSIDLMPWTDTSLIEIMKKAKEEESKKMEENEAQKKEEELKLRTEREKEENLKVEAEEAEMRLREKAKEVTKEIEEKYKKDNAEKIKREKDEKLKEKLQMERKGAEEKEKIKKRKQEL